MYKIIGCDKYKGNIIYYYNTDEKCVDFFEVESTIKPLMDNKYDTMYPFVLQKGGAVNRYTLLKENSDICLLSFGLKSSDFTNYCERFLIICNLEVADKIEDYFNRIKVAMARKRIAGADIGEQNETLDFEMFVEELEKDRYIMEFMDTQESRGQMFGHFSALCFVNKTFNIKQYFKYDGFGLLISELSIVQDFVSEFLSARKRLDISGDKIDYKKLLRKPVYTKDEGVIPILRYFYSMVSDNFYDKSHTSDLRILFMLYNKTLNRLVFLSRGTIEWYIGSELMKIEYDLYEGKIYKEDIKSENLSKYLETSEVIWLVNFLDSDLLNLLKNENIFNVVHDL